MRVISVLIWTLLAVFLFLVLVVFISCEIPRDRGFLTDDLSIINRIESSSLYRVVKVTQLDGKYFIEYTINRGGIFYWEREAFEKERIKIGLPRR